MRRLSFGKNNHLAYYSLALNPRYVVPHQGTSNEYSQHMFLWRSKKKQQHFPDTHLIGSYDSQAEKAADTVCGPAQSSQSLKIEGISTKNFFFLFLSENICCGYSLEVPQRRAITY